MAYAKTMFNCDRLRGVSFSFPPSSDRVNFDDVVPPEFSPPALGRWVWWQEDSLCAEISGPIPVISLFSQSFSFPSSVTSKVEITLRTIKEKGVKLLSIEKIRSYLLKHPEITETLLSLCDKALSSFDASVQLVLELYRDPEIEDEYLTIYVRQMSYQTDILEIIESISADPDCSFEEGEGWVLLTTDFKAQL